MGIDKELLDILACPKCKNDLTLSPDETSIICNTCRVRYPIKDDIPILLIDEAIPLKTEP